MFKRLVSVFVVFTFLVVLAGCATGRKQGLEVQGLRNQVSVLEAQLQAKDEEINQLKDALNKIPEETSSQLKRARKKRVIGEAKSRPSTKQVQIALRNAGFDPGPVDGRKGRQTRDAIRAFQRANNLAVDGKAGRETWGLLKEYLYKKVK